MAPGSWLGTAWDFVGSGYVRPDITTEVILDDEGRAIPFGHRWGADGPPADAYSVVTHPERFGPLVTVADALVAYLNSKFDVTIETDVTASDREPKPSIPPNPNRSAVTRTVKVTPNRRDAAGLTIIYTSFPSIEVQAGVFFAEPFPDCGCDACDDEWSGVADHLESVVLAVVHGTFSETVTGRSLETRLWYPDGSSASAAVLKDLPYSSPYITQALDRLKSLPAGWQPWPARS